MENMCVVIIEKSKHNCVLTFKDINRVSQNITSLSNKHKIFTHNNKPLMATSMSILKGECELIYKLPYTVSLFVCSLPNRTKVK